MDAVSGDGAPVVGIVDGADESGPETETPSDPLGATATPALETALSPHDATVLRNDLEAVLEAEPTLLVAAGDATLSAIARAGADSPVLPVGDVTGIAAVDPERVPAALESVLENGADVRRHPVVTVTVEGPDGDPIAVDRSRALFDVTLVTEEPARISEFAVSSRGEAVETIRADGVVAATPAGSHGYASALEAPHLSTAVDALAVEPIAPFVTQTRRWVLPDDDLALTVERDEGKITLVVDEAAVATIGIDSRVAVSVVDTLSTIVVPDDGGD